MNEAAMKFIDTIPPIIEMQFAADMLDIKLYVAFYEPTRA